MSEHPRELHRGRRRDRRAGLHALLATMARVVTARGNAAPLRGAFEEALRRAVGLQTVHLRDLNSRWRTAPPRGPASIAFDVPAASPASRASRKAR
jgi:hypothetical protein